MDNICPVSLHGIRLILWDGENCATKVWIDCYCLWILIEIIGGIWHCCVAHTDQPSVLVGGGILKLFAGSFRVSLLLARLESAYSLIWGARWDFGIQDLGTFMISRSMPKAVIGKFSILESRICLQWSFGNITRQQLDYARRHFSLIWGAHGIWELGLALISTRSNKSFGGNSILESFVYQDVILQHQRQQCERNVHDVIFYHIHLARCVH